MRNCPNLQSPNFTGDALEPEEGRNCKPTTTQVLAGTCSRPLGSQALYRPDGVTLSYLPSLSPDGITLSLPDMF